jgi:hypothetical protein
MHVTHEVKDAEVTGHHRSVGANGKRGLVLVPSAPRR